MSKESKARTLRACKEECEELIRLLEGVAPQRESATYERLQLFLEAVKSRLPRRERIERDRARWLRAKHPYRGT